MDSTKNGSTAHLTEDTLRLLRLGVLPDSRRDAALFHISRCPDCAAAFAEGFDEAELLPLPPDFTKDTASRRETRAGRRDGGYILRVCGAVVAALLLLFVRVDDQPRKPAPPDLSFLQTATERLIDFSDRLLNLEALRDDQKAQ